MGAFGARPISRPSVEVLATNLSLFLSSFPLFSLPLSLRFAVRLPAVRPDFFNDWLRWWNSVFN